MRIYSLVALSIFFMLIGLTGCAHLKRDNPCALGCCSRAIPLNTDISES